MYVVGVKHGAGLEVSDTGDRETRTWEQGVLHGPAVIQGNNGDRMEFKYVQVKSFIGCG